MTEKDYILLQMLAYNYPHEKIAAELQESPRQFYRRLMNLRHKGYEFIRQFESDGHTKYILKKDEKKAETNTQEIKLHNTDTLRALVYSDVHVGNKLANPRYQQQLHQFCLDHNIHIMIDLGDHIDGIRTMGEQTIADPNKQLEEMLKYYPYDEHLLTFSLFGDHEYCAYKGRGFNMALAIEEKRPDIIPIGYGLGILNVDNDQIILRHPIRDLKFKTPKQKLVLEGHHHQYQMAVFKDGCRVSVPSCSNLIIGSGSGFPSALLMQLKLNDSGHFTHGYFTHLGLLGNEPCILSESSVEMSYPQNKVTYEDFLCPKQETETIIHDHGQSEKFNRRWGRQK